LVLMDTPSEEHARIRAAIELEGPDDVVPVLVAGAAARQTRGSLDARGWWRPPAVRRPGDVTNGLAKRSELCRPPHAP
jgi:hypothetical protein